MLFFCIKFSMFKIKIKDKIAIIIIIIIILTYSSLNFLSSKIMPKIMAYAKIESEKLGTLLINDAVSKKVIDTLNIDDLFIITRDNNGEIISVDFNTIIVNKILTTSTHQIELSLNFLEKDKISAIDLPDNVSFLKQNSEGIYLLIPSGVVLKNSFLANLGPKIPVKLEFVGSVLSGISTNITNYGINNALVEVYLDLEVALKVIMPFIADDVKVKTSIPIAIKMLNGKVPQYYLGGYLNNRISN